MNQFEFMINNEKFQVEILEETSETYKVKVNDEIIMVLKQCKTMLSSFDFKNIEIFITMQLLNKPSKTMGAN